jgi:hypothetical protein
MEVLVMAAIIVILAALGVASIHRIRQAQLTAETANNLKLVALLLHSFNDVYKRYPPAWGPFPPASNPSGGPSATFHYWLLPFIQSGPEFVWAAPSRAGANAQIWTLPEMYCRVIPPYLSPLDPTTSDGTVLLSGATPWGVGNIAANARVFGGLRKNATPAAWDNKAQLAFVSDGLSNTIFFATRYGKCGDFPGGSAWAGGNTTASFGNFMVSGAFFASEVEDSPLTGGGFALKPPFQVLPPQGGGSESCFPLLAHAFTTAGIQIALGDGSVRTVSPSISSRTWGEACHPSDDLTISTSWQE